jgi:hypothetical protein
MVRNIPTICIDGKIKFVSVMPKREELIKAIQNRINEKLRYKIARRRSQVLIFGDDSESSMSALENVKDAVKELGVDVEVSLITDDATFREFGIRTKPTIVTAKFSVKSAGKVPEVKIIKEWVKHLED